MRYCVTVGFKAHGLPPELITGPEVPIAEQEAALDALARKDDGAGFIVRALWYGDNGAPRRVDFSSPEQKAAREQASSDDAARHAAKESAKAQKLAALIKQAEALGFDPRAAEAEAAKARAEAEAAAAARDAAEAELKALKASMRAVEASMLPETTPGSEVHTLVPEGATPSPATNPTPTEQQGAGESGAPETPAPAPVSGARKRP